MTALDWIVGITGASGSIYGLRLIEAMQDLGMGLHLVVSEAGERVLREETGKSLAEVAAGCRLHDVRDVGAAIASGSFPAAGMIVIPCSMHTVAAMALGLADNLLTRAADVTLKEGRPLIVVPRETPLHLIHLENLRRLAQAGARIVPAMPAFYHRPTTMNELVDFVVGKVLDQAGIAHQLFKRWGETE
ncbi:3-octaprenyl-4-hydroxybenzoate carboxy-lyase [Heliomicrobium modesticaldum Ice1]|uniref:Flavin prenyltransferase UbiX n=1 Tax=Heliobacterium modesticaldum (strain ATCC 51547 / Ice1) TaxID=498761 RepID=B0TGB0_HELMI|nr:UbiX family flavin prenyltransferase [Heliomicrobium modesticaldum]ABZ84606.1 3-octaprenyl-4-hydroxybenzoate carboxy-lyase [Heliomicrobium modesticaldum Ice1]